jgi:hypothetical protein
MFFRIFSCFKKLVGVVAIEFMMIMMLILCSLCSSSYYNYISLFDEHMRMNIKENWGPTLSIFGLLFGPPSS